MDIHKNARLTRQSRALLVDRVLADGWTVAEASAAAGVSERTGWKWLARFRDEGLDGLYDRSSRPRRSRGTGVGTRRRIVKLRRARLTCRKIASHVRRSRATVARIIKAAGLARLRSLDAPPPPVVRYEYDRVGGLLHLDTKKLARIEGLGHRITGNRRGQKRGVGYDFAHVCIDDHSRVAYVEILGDECGETAAAFFRRAVAWYTQLGVNVERVLTDNGTCYRSHVFAAACRDPAIRHLRTKPYTPRTNGKAERLIQTLLREWAYRYPFRSSAERLQLLGPYLHFYNHHRMHSALADQPPISRLTLNNVMRRNS
jgi:transposase InsO family protein